MAGGGGARFRPVNGLIEVGAVRRGCGVRRGRSGRAETSCGGKGWPAQGSAAACSCSARWQLDSSWKKEGQGIDKGDVASGRDRDAQRVCAESEDRRRPARGVAGGRSRDGLAYEHSNAQEKNSAAFEKF